MTSVTSPLCAAATTGPQAMLAKTIDVLIVCSNPLESASPKKLARQKGAVARCAVTALGDIQATVQVNPTHWHRHPAFRMGSIMHACQVQTLASQW